MAVTFNPRLSSGSSSGEARARHVRKLVLLDVYERFRVDVVDAEAVRWLAVPDELRAP